MIDTAADIENEWPLFLGFAGLAVLGPLLAAAWLFEARSMARKVGA